MSLAGLILDPEMNHNKKTFHRRNDSGELDVFEAARYFSGYNEVVGYNNNSTFTQKMIREERHRGRISLDMPMRSLLPQQFHGVVDKQMKEKKHKQPSSPGGKLASFLNSLFNQSMSKKKKSSKSSSQSMKDEDESPGGRRRRRSSISHFRSSSNNGDSRSVTGFRTPPYNVITTPTKGCKEFRNLLEQKHDVKSSNSLRNEFFWDDKKKRDTNLQRNFVDKQYSAEGKGVRNLNEVVDDGAESDSSSDLFELQNYDLCHYSSGLPVYETTNMENIKRGATISNVN
ncbi:protein BIG GRAIN 1-like E [Cicer arietinum]|uniref:Protein BIG GRAIN 1-like E n=1 Tax=Cicer arietinum TaxID=3827 RepID=A0A1S2XJE3_CICAR|nr:protein BIG GRAIN 1-like E [Cicer arietinum]